MMPAIPRLSLVLMLAVSLMASVPMSCMAQSRPAVDGIVLEGGKPIAGVELFLGKFPGKNEPCTDVGELIPVSADGSFSWTPARERERTDAPTDPGAVIAKLTALCIRHPAKGVLIGVMLFMRRYDPVAIRLDCDVARPHRGGNGPNTVSSMLGQPQYCEAAAAN
ncbi:hypothetical protein NX786_09270 [Telluria mixta]|uniref:Uncharacterized protein n=1 Tax=Telluria mixta TaxID=34071 RepID=A0ABT2BWK9_9BURK|nr:hypothetical protein [Telluria mixta]MCS0629523.1 hypothetical protein [Telluria mixta]WEM96902.1 hypothetical protein P0M04_03940 [Telluria mixta]